LKESAKLQKAEKGDQNSEEVGTDADDIFG
jgi:hypothetical protein